jgi:hypothetical protein
MAEMFDPNAGAQGPDFAQQEAAILRQKKIAELLRKQAMAQQMPQGQMVSGRFVKPNWMQALAPLLAQANASGYERDTAKAEDQYAKQTEQARQQWANSNFPKALAARPELQGPVDPNTGSPELEAQPAQPVTTGQILKKYFEGQIPGNEKAADAYLRTAGAERTLEDTQAARADAAELLQVSQNERLVEQGKQRLEQIRLQLSGKPNVEQQLMLKKQEDATKRYIADKSAAARLGAAEAGARARGAKVDKVPNTVVKSIREAEDVSEGLGTAYSTYKPEYGGVMGTLSQWSGRYNPLASKESIEAANWKKNYEDQVALVERHAMFGTALSAGEQAAWKAATIGNWENPEVVANNLKTRATLSAKLYNKVLEQYSKLGYPQVLQAFDPHPESYEAMPVTSPTPASTGIPTQQLKPVAPPQRRSTDVPAPRQLPPGIERG